MAATSLNANLSIPFAIKVVARPCKDPRAFYDSQTRDVVLCYGLVEELLARDSAGIGNGQQFRISRRIAFVVAHELGHALIHRLNLPFVGNEEIAADQVGAMLFIADDRIAAGWAISGTILFYELVADQPPLTERTGRQSFAATFGGDHPLLEQRFSNLACWTQGLLDKEPLEVAEQYVARDRLAGCRPEALRARESWRRLLRPYLRTASAAGLDK